MKNIAENLKEEEEAEEEEEEEEGWEEERGSFVTSIVSKCKPKTSHKVS